MGSLGLPKAKINRLAKPPYASVSVRACRSHVGVEPQNIDKCEHALQSLRRSMAWDEEVLGL